MSTLGRWNLLDRERILAKIDELDGYLRELIQIKPTSFEEYQKIELVYEILQNKLVDIEAFKQEILQAIRNQY